MKNRIVIILSKGLVLTLFLLIACAPKEALIPAPTLVKEEKIIDKEPGQGDWERTLGEAQKEGRVVVYGGSSAAALKLHATKLLKEKFGFNIEVLAGKAAELDAKIGTERLNGLYIPDLYFAGATTIYNDFKPRGWVVPLEPMLILPEVLDSNAWHAGRLPWGDKKRTVFIVTAYKNRFIAINTNLVKSHEMTSFQDLLDPKWKDKIVINDPTVGKGNSSFTEVLYNKMVDLDYFKELVRKQNPVITREMHFPLMWLTRGKFSIALFLSEATIGEYMKGGAPISTLDVKEGTVVSGAGTALTLMNNAPHPNATKIFINWFLSKEGQYMFQGATDKQSARADIPVDNLDPLLVRKPGEKYLTSPSVP